MALSISFEGYTIHVNIVSPNELHAFIFHTIKDTFVLGSFSSPTMRNIIFDSGILINRNSMRCVAFDNRLVAMHPIVELYLCIDRHAERIRHIRFLSGFLPLFIPLGAHHATRLK